MDKQTIKPFEVKLQKESNYYRMYVTHPNFKGRIRKRLGDRQYDDLESIAFNIRYELGKHFQSHDIYKQDVETFIEKYVSMNVKCDASIFDYSADFLASKSAKVNNRTKIRLSKSTLSGYRTALKYFEAYLSKNKISPHPSSISNSVLDNYYTYIPGVHNYKTKLHTKLKGFINYIETVKQLPVDPSYKLSKFTEEYDNQCPEDDDIALQEEDVRKLIELRNKFQRGEVNLESHLVSCKIPDSVQQQQFKMKEKNVIKCLDCFLFMISTGLYHADIMKSKLLFSTNGKSIKYRRAKNGSLCKGIPVNVDDIFIGEEIINQYKIKNGSNFPLNLSLNHFAKHLKRISTLAKLDYMLTNKMARKTFASVFYFKRGMPINYVQILLGHNNVKDTAHYLRITDDDIANEISKYMSLSANKV
jgi:site-specific recombinase XerD